LAALACLKYGTVQDRVQFTKDRGSFNIIESAGIAVDSFAPDLVVVEPMTFTGFRLKAAAMGRAAAF